MGPHDGPMNFAIWDGFSTHDNTQWTDDKISMKQNETNQCAYINGFTHSSLCDLFLNDTVKHAGIYCVIYQPPMGNTFLCLPDLVLMVILEKVQSIHPVTGA